MNIHNGIRKCNNTETCIQYNIKTPEILIYFQKKLFFWQEPISPKRKNHHMKSSENERLTHIVLWGRRWKLEQWVWSLDYNGDYIWAKDGLSFLNTLRTPKSSLRFNFYTNSYFSKTLFDQIWERSIQFFLKKEFQKFRLFSFQF